MAIVLAFLFIIPCGFSEDQNEGFTPLMSLNNFLNKGWDIITQSIPSSKLHIEIHPHKSMESLKTNFSPYRIIFPEPINETDYIGPVIKVEIQTENGVRAYQHYQLYGQENIDLITGQLALMLAEDETIKGFHFQLLTVSDYGFLNSIDEFILSQKFYLPIERISNEGSIVFELKSIVHPEMVLARVYVY